MVCRHCRQPIRDGWEKHFGELIAPYVHEVGMYTCPTHPETLAEPADLRWEKVQASIGAPEISGDDLETGYAEFLRTVVEFRIEVPYAGSMLYSTIRVTKDELEHSVFNMRGYILDNMVEMIDDAMKEAEREKSSCN